MKGLATLFFVFLLAVGMLTFTSTLVLSMRIRVIGHQVRTFESINTEYALLSFLRAQHNGKSNMQALLECYEKKSNCKSLISDLDRIGGPCYELFLNEKLLFNKGTCKPLYSAFFYIPNVTKNDFRYVKVELHVGK